MDKIRIMHIAQCAGGVDCYLRMLLRYMDHEAFEQVLVCSKDYHAADYEGIADKFIQVDMQKALSLSGDARAIRAVRRLIKELQPHIIYCHSSKAGGVGRIANIGLGVPVVYNAHGWAFNLKGARVKRMLYVALERMLAPLTRQFVTISNNEKLKAIQYRIAHPRRIRTIFNGIDLETAEQLQTGDKVTRASLGIPESAYLVGMVGRICETKAPDTFVRMAQIVKRNIPQAWFMIVGDGEERKETERLIAANGLTDCFCITGWVSNPLAYAKLFDQGLLLSRWEGFGLVLAEYMALSKPIVATEADAIPDLITDYENGLLVAVDDEEEAARAVVEIYSDKSLRKHLVENGRDRVRILYDVKRTAREHNRLFLKLMDTAKHSK